MSVKRTIEGEARSVTDKKFEIDTNTFVVASLFNNTTFVHIRKYDGKYPTKEGVCLHPSQWNDLIEILKKGEKGTHNSGYITVKRTKTAVMLEKGEKSIMLKSLTVVKNLLSR